MIDNPTSVQIKKVLLIVILISGMLVFCHVLLQAESQHDRLRLDLDRAIRIGTTNSFVIQSQKYRQKIQRKLITERWREYMPEVGVSVERRRTINADAQDVIANEVRFNVQQVLLDGGQRSMDVDMAKLDAILSRQDFKLEYGRLRLAIARTYLTALANRGKIQLNQKSLQRSYLQLKQIRNEKELGFSTDARVYQVAAGVREIQLAVHRSRNQYNQSLYALNTELNLEHTARLSLEGNLFFDYRLLPPEVNVNKLIARALFKHPDVIKSMGTVKRKEAERGIEENYWIPRITLNGYVGRTGVDYPLRDRVYGGGITFTFPLYDNTIKHMGSTDVTGGGTGVGTTSRTEIGLMDNMGRSRRLMNGRLGYREALHEHRRKLNQIALRIQQESDRLHESWETIRIGNGRVYFQYQTLKNMQDRYRIGELRRDEIIEAERELIQAQEDLTDAIAAYIIAVYSLEYAAALEPGSLQMVRHEPGQGNTLLPFVLRDDFKAIQRLVKEKIVPLNFEELPEDRREGEEFLIDRVESP